MFISENSCSKNFVNFQEKHAPESAFVNRAADCLTLSGNVFLGIYEIFRTTFPRNTRNWRLLQLVFTEKRFNQNIYF